MTNAPDRIWIEDEFGDGDEDQWTYGTWDVRNYMGYDVEYVRADRIDALTAKLADAMDGLEKCQAELDEYSRQEYPLNHSVHERYRQRDYNANPARITLAALKGETP